MDAQWWACTIHLVQNKSVNSRPMPSCINLPEIIPDSCCATLNRLHGIVHMSCQPHINRSTTSPFNDRMDFHVFLKKQKWLEDVSPKRRYSMLCMSIMKLRKLILGLKRVRQQPVEILKTFSTWKSCIRSRKDHNNPQTSPAISNHNTICQHFPYATTSACVRSAEWNTVSKKATLVHSVPKWRMTATKGSTQKKKT